MKRLMFIVVLAAAVVVPSTAVSSSDSTAKYSTESSAKRAFEGFNFTVFTRNGRPVKVGKFRYKDADADCGVGGPLLLSGKRFGTERRGSNGRANVNNGKFSKTYPAESEGGGEGQFKVIGEFKHNNNRIVGYFRAKGDYPAAGASDCDTGKEEYEVR